MQPTRPLRPAIKAEVAADTHGLPHGRITEHGTEAHVFTAGLDDLVDWYMALGGRITCEQAGPGVCLWTLHTDTDHGNGTPVRVHALALDTDQIDADCADAVDQRTNGSRPGFTDAWGLCLTCRGHGSLTVDGEEIPYEDLSPRRKQGYDLGHRFYRNTSKPCPDCDGQDRATDAAISAYESTC